MTLGVLALSICACDDDLTDLSDDASSDVDGDIDVDVDIDADADGDIGGDGGHGSDGDFDADLDIEDAADGSLDPDAEASGAGIIVTSPAAGDDWPRGSSQVIRWEDSLGAQDSVWIILRTHDSSDRFFVARGTENDGSYEITVPCEVPAGSYYVRVRYPDGSARDDGEDFLISEGATCPACDGHCSNGVRDCGEGGVDCGGGCLSCELTIYEDNPRYFVYRGRVRPMLSSGGASFNDETLSEWSELGINQVRYSLMIDVDHSNPYRWENPRRTNVDNNWGGWDETYWNRLREQVGIARDQGFAMFVTVYGSPMFICSRDGDCPDNWGVNLWNVERGGPLTVTNPSIRAAKELFYQLASPDEPIFGREEYDPSWGWRRKNQYRQEQLLAEVVSRLPRDEFPNLAIGLMWEMNVSWGAIEHTESWGRAMVRYLQELAPDMPVGVGTYIPSQIEAVDADFGMGHGFNPLDDPPLDRPLVFEGFHPRDECWLPGRPEPQCTCFDGVRERETCGEMTDEACAARASRVLLRDLVLGGINLSMPFPQYWAHQTRRVGLCESIGQWDFDREVVREEVIAYVSELSEALDGVTDWSDEPGDEVRAARLPRP